MEEIETAMLFGFVKRDGAAVAIANRIFETRLYDRFLTSSEWTFPPVFFSGAQFSF